MQLFNRMPNNQLLHKSRLLGSTISVISICLLGSAIWMSQMPHNIQWGDEPLIVFDHVSQLKNGAEISSLNYARIPSLLPDYLLAFITSHITPSIRQQYFWFTLLTGGLQILMMSAVVKQVTKSKFALSALMVSITGHTLGFVNENIAFNLSFARYPVNHGGNLILVLLAANLFLSSSSLSRGATSLANPAAQTALNFFGTISNRIFVPQATIPLIIGHSYRYRRSQKGNSEKNAAKATIGLISASTLIGLLVSEILINTGCTPPIAINIEGFQTVVQGMFKDKDLLLASSGFLVCLGTLIPILLPAEGKDAGLKKNEYLIFSLSSTLITVALWSMLWRNEPVGTYYNRYIFNLYGFTVIGFSVLLSNILRLASFSNFNFKSLLMFAIFCSITIAQAGSINNAFATFKNYSNPYADLIKKHANSLDNIYVLTDQQGSKGSRGIKASTNERIWASSISSNGLPNPWDQGKSEFREGNSREIKDYSMVMTSSSNVEKMIQRYGEPGDVTTDEKLGVSLLMYSTQESLAGIKKSIKRGLRGDFKTQCADPLS